MIFIRDLQENQQVTSYCQVHTKQLRRKRNGDPYLRLVLADRTGRIEGKMWDGVEGAEAIREGDFAQYQGTVQLYNDSRQVIIERIRKAGTEDGQNGFRIGDLIPHTDYDVETMWNRLWSTVDKEVSRPCVRQLLQKILREHEGKIKSYPAGIEIHHNYWGGFLEHILSVTESALFFARKYAELDRDLLVAGALLHDIGKLEELSDPSNPAYTARGQLIGHVVLGRDLLREEAARISDFPPDFLLRLEHVILSHQGQLEWGSPKTPKIPEALVLHYIDDLDAKVNRFFLVLKENSGDLEFTAYDRHLGRALFKKPASESPEEHQEVGC